jgi:GTP-binding protein
VDDRPGITRDRNYALCDWNGRLFYLIDTGGMIPGSGTAINRLVLEQSEIAVEQADLVVLIVDNKTGPDDIDRKIAQLLHKTGKKVLLLANKADNAVEESEIYQFLSLGLGDPLPVSATVGLGVGEVLDAIVDYLPDYAEEMEAHDSIRIAVIGRPNAGKSLFINRLIGEDRVIVSDVPGTTRDSVDTPFQYEDKNYVLIDTAGLRRKARVKEDIEYYTTLRTLRAIENCDVALVLVDASEGMAFQDLKIIEDAAAARRAIVIAINKWDLVEKDDKTADKLTREMKEQAKTFSYIPIIYISSLTGKRVVKTISYINKVYENWHRKAQTSELNNFLEEIYQKQLPAAARGKYIKFYYITQSDIKPPTFVIFCNYPELLQKSYLRYIENRLREKYDFEGIPIRIKVKKRGKK